MLSNDEIGGYLSKAGIIALILIVLVFVIGVVTPYIVDFILNHVSIIIK